MQRKWKSDSLSVETSHLPPCKDTNVLDWLADTARAVEAADEDIGREYMNIGGRNGLELFV